jgi:hypothetical protein
MNFLEIKNLLLKKMKRGNCPWSAILSV